MGYEARAVANFLLDTASEEGFTFTHMALHKITYFAHGWRLVQSGLPLVTEDFQAWEYGPVLPTVYAAFKAAGRGPITTRAERFDPRTQSRVIASVDLATEDRAFLRHILRAYGRLDALTLSNMTHHRGGAWDQVWNAPGGRITLAMKITNESIRDEFLRQSACAAGDRKGRAF